MLPPRHPQQINILINQIHKHKALTNGHEQQFDKETNTINETT